MPDLPLRADLPRVTSPPGPFPSREGETQAGVGDDSRVLTRSKQLNELEERFARPSPPLLAQVPLPEGEGAGGEVPRRYYCCCGGY